MSGMFLVAAAALAFDFTNGFHDTANAMATSIATGALRPRTAVLLSGALNVVGAFLSLAVASTIATGIVDAHAITITTVFAGLLGAIIWNLITWYFGLPSSSSHALIGGVVGATLITAGGGAVNGAGIVSRVLVPAVASPVIAAVVALCVTYAVARIADRVPEESFRVAQIASASLVSLAHGTNDAQKTMGVITLALIAGHLIDSRAGVPLWVIVICAVAMGLGTYMGGWRVIRNLGKRLTGISPSQGFAAEAAAAAVIFTSSQFGLPLSTTQVCSGSILGSGLGRPGAEVRWGVAGRMVIAWLLTLPAAAASGAAIGGAAEGIGGVRGVVVAGAMAIVFIGGIWLLARRDRVNAGNVNEPFEAVRPSVARSA